MQDACQCTSGFRDPVTMKCAGKLAASVPTACDRSRLNPLLLQRQIRGNTDNAKAGLPKLFAHSTHLSQSAPPE